MVVIYQNSSALMNTRNMFYGEIQIFMPLYRQMPSSSVSYLQKFPVALF